MEKSKIENVQSKPGPFPSVAQPCGPSPGPLGLLACCGAACLPPPVPPPRLRPHLSADRSLLLLSPSPQL